MLKTAKNHASRPIIVDRTWSEEDRDFHENDVVAYRSERLATFVLLTEIEKYPPRGAASNFLNRASYNFGILVRIVGIQR
jgi:hypothetical protein